MVDVELTNLLNAETDPQKREQIKLAIIRSRWNAKHGRTIIPVEFVAPSAPMEVDTMRIEQSPNLF